MFTGWETKLHNPLGCNEKKVQSSVAPEVSSTAKYTTHAHSPEICGRSNEKMFEKKNSEPFFPFLHHDARLTGRQVSSTIKKRGSHTEGQS